MPIHFRYLIAAVMFTCSTAQADLPADADRELDMQLAGFLYSQGVYKKTSGHFAALSEEFNSSTGMPEAISVEFPSEDSAEGIIGNWIKSTKHSISMKDLLNQ